MAQSPKSSSGKFGVIVDPDCVPETLCLGPFHVLPRDPATITFTHSRSKADPLLNSDRLEFETVIRARIVVSRDHLISLRDLLNEMLPKDADKEQTSAETTGAASRRQAAS